MMKLSEFHPVSGMIVVIPDAGDEFHEGSGLRVQQQATDQSVGTVVKHNAANLPQGTTKVVYRRMTSQSISMEDADGEVREYRTVHIEDLTGYVSND